MDRLVWAALACTAIALAQPAETAADLAARYLPELIRLDTTNPPGNETRVARYLKQVADREGIPAELLGDDPATPQLCGAPARHGQAAPAAADRAQRCGARRSLAVVGGSPGGHRKERLHLRARGRGRQATARRRTGRDGGSAPAQSRARSRHHSAFRVGRRGRVAGRHVDRSACVGEDRRRVRAQRILVHSADALGCARLPDPDGGEGPDALQDDGARHRGAWLAAARR